MYDTPRGREADERDNADSNHAIVSTDECSMARYVRAVIL